MTPQPLSYGSWLSPITADLIVANSIGLGETMWDGQTLYWVEMRPAEKGRNVLMGWIGATQGSPATNTILDPTVQEITGAAYNVRTRVHEYGGDCCTLWQGVAYFSNFADQRLYRLVPGAQPQPLTLEGVDLRFANGTIDPHRPSWIGIQEDHRGTGEAVNSLVRIPLPSLAETPQPQEAVTLHQGHDFYAYPCLSPDGQYLAWITWDHPQMPWDGTELWVAQVQADGSLKDVRRVAGGRAESIFQPQWSPDGWLYFVSDRSNWWNLYRWHPSSPLNGDPLANGEALYPMEAEFGLPLWNFGMSTYGFISPEEILCTYQQDGISHLARLQVSSRTLQRLPLDYTSIRNLTVQGDLAAFVGGSALEPSTLVVLDLANNQSHAIRCSHSLDLDRRYLSQPESIAFPTDQGRTAYGLYYPPANGDYSAPPTERPPLVVKSHGGPTAAAKSSLDLGIQYWTSRGFGVLDVNYGGSTGYGREYRERLKGQWGVVDVADCAHGALYLVERGDVDGDRLTIEGGSAGGYTTLCALIFTPVFKAGCSRYGVSDLTALAEDTHKFESRYLDSLVGAYPAQKEVYLQRSPLQHPDKLNCPVIFFQGLEDKIVPPNQTEMMVEALKKKGIPVAYVAFPGEQHGFRQGDNIKRSLEGQLYFYSQVFGFATAEAIEPVPIFNFTPTA